MLAAGGSGPAGAEFRSVLVNSGFNTKQRAMAPENVADTLSWLERNTREVGELSDAALCRKVLAAATTKLDGTRAAPTSVRRNRAVLLNALDYAVELKLLDQNPIKNLKWRAPKTAWEVDRRVVVNPSRPERCWTLSEASSPAVPASWPCSVSSTTTGCAHRK